MVVFRRCRSPANGDSPQAAVVHGGMDCPRVVREARGEAEKAIGSQWGDRVCTDCER